MDAALGTRKLSMVSPRQALTWTVVVSAVVFVLGYDGWQLWKSRPLACDLIKQDCPQAKTCSAPSVEQKPRCLPIADPARATMNLPFELKTPIRCAVGPRDGQVHITDFDSFALSLSPSSPKATAVVASLAGQAYIVGQTLRILHEGGYYSRYFPLQNIKVQNGYVETNTVLGELAENTSLEFSVHYLNPETAPQVLATSEAEGFSVPFYLHLSLDQNGQKLSRDFPVTEIECGEGSNFLFYRAKI